MFESHAERLIELPHDRKGCVGILYVIVGHLLAIKLPGIGQRIGHPFAAAVELGLLVRILSVAERLNQIELQEQLLVEPRFSRMYVAIIASYSAVWVYALAESCNRNRGVVLPYPLISARIVS